MKLKKILFGITGLTLGGAERVLIDLANELSDKYEVTIFTIYDKGEGKSSVSEKVKIKSLYSCEYNDVSKLQKILVPIKILLMKRKIYNTKIKDDYDIEISFLEGAITRLFSVKNKKARKIAWIHNDVSLVFGKSIKSKIKKSIDKKIYGKYETLVFVSRDNLKQFNNTYKDVRDSYLQPIRKEVIYNYINKDIIIQKSEEKEELFENNTINFISVARLVEQKRIDRIIKVHAKLIKEGLKHNFYVIGDGPLKEKLEELVKQEKVEETFKLLGKKENPYPYIKNSDYFCLLSEFEGYGMVLEEAKILNKPIIITDTAAREAVSKYANSKIVPNSEDGIYLGIKEILTSKNHNKTFLEIDKDIDAEEYDNSKIVEKIIELLEK